jgi:hypothetical protein
MKSYIFFAFALLFVPEITFGQIEVIQREFKYKEISYKTFGMQKQLILEEVEMLVDDESVTPPQYRLIYKDYRYPSILSLQMVYIDTKESLMDIKRLIYEGFESKEKEYRVMFKMGEETMSVVRVKTLGVSSAYILVQGKGFTPQLSKNAWETFFSKVQ